MTASDLFTPDLFNGRRVRLTAPHPAGPIPTRGRPLRHEWEAARQTW